MQPLMSRTVDSRVALELLFATSWLSDSGGVRTRRVTRTIPCRAGYLATSGAAGTAYVYELGLGSGTEEVQCKEELTYVPGMLLARRV